MSRHTLHVLCVEVGTDLSRFPDAEHRASWAGMCPGHKESAGKRHSGRTCSGNRYVKTALVQAAHVTAKTGDLSGRAILALEAPPRQETGSARSGTQHPDHCLPLMISSAWDTSKPLRTWPSEE